MSRKVFVICCLFALVWVALVFVRLYWTDSQYFEETLQAICSQHPAMADCGARFRAENSMWWHFYENHFGQWPQLVAPPVLILLSGFVWSVAAKWIRRAGEP